ncbi:MAG: SiaC family regulatory phosphoprotein [Bacteroidia bacterium]
MHFHHPGSNNYPEVWLDLMQKRFFFRGMSVMPDAQGFYGKIVDWFKQQKPHLFMPLLLQFELYYINTASMKAINEMIRTLVEEGISVHLRGIYHEPTDNQEVLDFLADLARVHQIPYSQEGVK